MEPIRPSRGGFLRPFGCGAFIRDYLMGRGPEGSPRIDPVRGATQSDINYQYKEALAKVEAHDKAERVISRMVKHGEDVTEEEAENIYQRELKKTSRKFTHMRYHSFVDYFAVLKRLGWVEPTGKREKSAIMDNDPSAPRRVYYRLTEAGRNAEVPLWNNPLFTLYPEFGANHHKK